MDLNPPKNLSTIDYKYTQEPSYCDNKIELPKDVYCHSISLIRNDSKLFLQGPEVYGAECISAFSRNGSYFESEIKSQPNKFNFSYTNETYDVPKTHYHHDHHLVNRTITVINSTAVSSHILQMAMAATTLRVFLTLFPTIVQETYHFPQNKKNKLALLASGLKITAAAALTIAPMISLGVGSPAASVLSAFGTFVFAGDSARGIFNDKQDRKRRELTFENKYGPAINAVKAQVNRDDCIKCATWAQRLGSQLLNGLAHAISVISLNNRTSSIIETVSILPTILGLFTKQNRAFTKGELDTKLLKKEYIEQFIPTMLIQNSISKLMDISHESIIALIEKLGPPSSGYYLGMPAYSDHHEKCFLASFIDICEKKLIYSESDCWSSKHGLDLIFDFSEAVFDSETTGCLIQSNELRTIMSWIQQQRNNDKRSLVSSRGCYNANHVYENVIALMIKVMALWEKSNHLLDAENIQMSTLLDNASREIDMPFIQPSASSGSLDPLIQNDSLVHHLRV